MWYTWYYICNRDTTEKCSSKSELKSVYFIRDAFQVTIFNMEFKSNISVESQVKFLDVNLELNVSLLVK